MSRPARCWGLLLAGLLLVGCTTPAQPPPTAPEPGTATQSDAAAPSGTEPTASARAVVTDLDAPWSMTFADRTLIISERDSGRILELAPDGQTRRIGQLEDVVHGGEGGLLGLAFREPDALYAYSTGPRGNRIQRFTLEGRPGNLKLSAPRTILDALPAAAIHNGGRIVVGPDGMLYAGVGDAANTSLPQDLESLGGKILRMTPDGGVPEDNPFPQSLVYSYGHRNVQGLAWSEDGTLYASEFGQNTWDELNLITPGGNYGWPEVEGIEDAGNRFTDPIAQWPTSQASPSGIAIQNGVLYLANLRGQRLRSVQLSDPSRQSEFWEHEQGRLRDVVATPEGELWVLTNNTDGRGTPGAQDDRILVLDPQAVRPR